MKFGVVVFPGSNCDHDTYFVIKHVAGGEVVFLWHQDTNLQEVDIVILPGGFSYGDYLRSGAIAKFSPIMESVKQYAARGGLVLGICNGFQILQEAGLLPGALLRNARLKFLCQPVNLRTEQQDTPFTAGLTPGELLRISDRPQRWQLLSSSRTAERTGGAGPGGLSLCGRGGPDNSRGQPERFSQWHRRDRQCPTKCSGHDAASGAGVGVSSRVDRRFEVFRFHCRGAQTGPELVLSCMKPGTWKSRPSLLPATD